VATERSSLVGRQRELDCLVGALDRAESGEGSVTLITGEPGIGKSSLLEHLAARAAERGLAVTWGRAWEAGGAPAHWIWIEALRSLTGEPGLDSDITSRVISLVLEASEVASNPFHLCDAVARFVRHYSSRQPLLILLDDLHAADVASLHVAHFVGRELRAANIAIVGSYRDVEARLSAPVEDALTKLGRLGEVLAIPRLDSAGVAELIRNEVGEATDDNVTEMIMTATEGNPLFVRELLRLLKARSVAPGVPSGVRSVIRERLALLSPATVALLQAAAVLGRECSLPLAAEVAGVTPRAMQDAAAEAMTAAILEPGDAARLRFSHALVAETLAADLSGSVRDGLHRKAAEILEARHAGDPAAPVADIARHWLAAGVDSAARAVDAAERAAAAAAARFAFADAAELLERALHSLDVAAPADTRRRVELMLSRCEALAQNGARAEAEVLCRQAAELARSLGDEELFARVALALGAELVVGHADAELKRLLAEALDGLAETDSPLRARVMARLAGARQPERDLQGPIAMAREAIAMARRLDDEAVLLYALFAGMGAMADYADPRERLPLNRECAALAEKHNIAPYEIRARMRILFDCADLMDGALFNDELIQLERLVERLAIPAHRWVPLAFAAMRADWQGKFDQGERLYREAAQLAGSDVGPFRFPARELLRLWHTDSDPPHEHALELIERLPSFMAGLSRAFRAGVLARRGELEQACELYRSVLKGGDLDRLIRPGDPRGLEFLAEFAWVLRDKDLAAKALELGKDLEGRALTTTGMAYLLSSTADQQCLAAAVVLGKWDEMERYADSALAQCQRLGAPPIAARIRYIWARGLLDKGEPARAIEQLEKAAAVAEELGMTGLLRRCRELQRAGEKTPASSAAVSLELEGEYWTVRGFAEVCRIKDSRGMQMLSALLEHREQELHVLDLSGARISDGGDAGALLDAEARAAYEARARDLRSELQDAEACNDPGRIQRAQAELDALTTELSRAFGLGGRERRAGNAVERARSNVRRRIADAMSKIEDSAPAIGEHLRASIKTGIYCSYAPR
jgi:hypothetical protein